MGTFLRQSWGTRKMGLKMKVLVIIREPHNTRVGFCFRYPKFSLPCSHSPLKHVNITCHEMKWGSKPCPTNFFHHKRFKFFRSSLEFVSVEIWIIERLIFLMYLFCFQTSGSSELFIFSRDYLPSL